ncbi:MAG: cytochrome c maturation protein CcmE [Rhodospirillaceae bacterium]|jgi:cytochrome c-type biogenesis protein CcmE|nr:cytochrome c maturation protein CcmE [Rhodospirillaceae bacterium]MBT6116794.1 cytochrome c maturation protein CcmE [Rhodospirillaceae bacterium]
MAPKRRRMTVILVALALLGAAAALALTALEDSVVFFFSPSDLATKSVAPGQRLRLGGLVEEGSVQRGDGARIVFKVTDLATAVPVVYEGILPDLFREGQGVVVEGSLGPDGRFEADSVLAKHDETYMPPEVAEALKKSGHWQDGAESETGDKE